MPYIPIISIWIHDMLSIEQQPKIIKEKINVMKINSLYSNIRIIIDAQRRKFGIEAITSVQAFFATLTPK